MNNTSRTSWFYQKINWWIDLIVPICAFIASFLIYIDGFSHLLSDSSSILHSIPLGFIFWIAFYCFFDKKFSLLFSCYFWWYAITAMLGISILFSGGRYPVVSRPPIIALFCFLLIALVITNVLYCRKRKSHVYDQSKKLYNPKKSDVVILTGFLTVLTAMTVTSSLSFMITYLMALERWQCGCGKLWRDEKTFIEMVVDEARRRSINNNVRNKMEP